jgi:hypothetical protein
MTGGSEDHSGDSESEPRSTSRYSIWVGAAFIVVVILATINGLRTDEGGPLGTDVDAAGSPLAEFAVPRLPDGPDGDANVFQDDCETSENPCPADARRTPACAVEGEGVIRVCDFFDRPLVLSFWFTTPADCPPTQDVIEAAARRHRGEVGFLSIAVRGDRAEIEDIAREGGWRISLGWDRDGAVSNLYRVAVCPTVAFVLPGGILSEATIGSEELTEAGLERQIAALLRESERRAEAPR